MPSGFELAHSELLRGTLTTVDRLIIHGHLRQNGSRSSSSGAGTTLLADGSVPKNVGSGAEMVAAFTWGPTRIVGDDGVENHALELRGPSRMESRMLNASVGPTWKWT
jgi:hypothetical protein